MTAATTKPFTLLRWTCACFLGWLAGVVLILVLSSGLDAMGIEHMQFYLGTGMGAGISLMQWRQLRRAGIQDVRWIWYAVLGLSLPFLVFDLLPAVPGNYRIPLSIITGSLLCAVLQYRLLRTPRAALWIPGNLAGWTLAVACVFSVDYTKHLQPAISSNLVLALINLLLILAGGIILGLITGITIRRILPALQ